MKRGLRMRKFAAWALCAAWMVFIFMMSAMPGDVSGEQSGFVTELIEKARRDGTIIINKQDGRGYYQPGPDDVADMLHQYRSNNSRAKSILAQQKHIRKRLREKGLEV